jgi:hypothetical protein
VGAGSADQPPPVACDAADIDMARACHCRRAGNPDPRPWGPSQDLRIEVTSAVTVASGELVEIPFALRHVGKRPVELDFVGGRVVDDGDLWKGKRRVEGPLCGFLGIRPPTVTLTLRPGAVVRGNLFWRATNHQSLECRGVARLPPGRYRLEVETVLGTPLLQAEVAITVTRKK